MKGNHTNHPPRTRQIRPSKGGRTVSRTFFLTPEYFAKLQASVKKQNISFNDWLEKRIDENP